MPIEHASVRAMHKPWGVSDLQPWSSIDGTGDAVGELWFERTDKKAPIPALLLKLLFTSAPLSIQVHPDDTFARAMGMANGKSEAWYIISAEPGAQIGVGLNRRITPQELRASITNGSIVELVQWRPVAEGDVIFIPAGTIHAIGAGIVLAEIQQRSDTTFRLFDYGRPRELHIDNGVAVANAWPLRSQPDPTQLTVERTVLVASQHFVLERIDLPKGSSWALLAEAETSDSCSRRSCGDWIGHGLNGAGDLRCWRSHQHRSWRQRVDRPDRVSGCRSSRFAVAAALRSFDRPRSIGRSRRGEIDRRGRGVHVTPLRKIAVIGNSLPRRCGIATFSTDLQRAIANSEPNLQTCIVAMTDHDQTYDYPASVALQIKDDRIEEYVDAAAFLNAGRVRHRLSAARIRNFRRRGRGPYPGTAVAPDYAGRHDAAHGAGRAVGGSARGDGAHRRGVLEGRRDGQQGP